MHRNRTFLIVDDEPDMCWALEHILGKNGLRSKTASTGREALALLKRNRFSLVFLDAKLPDIEGLQLAARIKEIDPYLPIVIVSGYYYRDDFNIQKALAGGLILGFVAKPFLHEEVLNTIKSVARRDIY